MVEAKWQILSAKVRGALHIRQEKPCQDAIDYHYFMPGGIVCAIADGHGSSECLYSEDGARLAANCAVNLISDMAYYNNEEALGNLMRQVGSVTLPRQIEKRWKEWVLVFHKEQKRPMPHMPQKEAGGLYKLYGTTLLVLVVTPTFLYAMQIGDGDMLCVDETGSVQYVIEPLRTYGVETHSLCERKAWRAFKTVWIPITDDFKGKLFLMSTDGYANSFVTSNDFLQVGKDYFNLLQHENIKAIEKMLPIWLEEASRTGSGDDMTLALITRRES